MGVEVSGRFLLNCSFTYTQYNSSLHTKMIQKQPLFFHPNALFNLILHLSGAQKISCLIFTFQQVFLLFRLLSGSRLEDFRISFKERRTSCSFFFFLRAFFWFLNLTPMCDALLNLQDAGRGCPSGEIRSLSSLFSLCLCLQAVEVERAMSNELQALKQELQQKGSHNRLQDEELISAMREQVKRIPKTPPRGWETQKGLGPGGHSQKGLKHRVLVHSTHFKSMNNSP